jgi:hypothetical protein
MPPPSSADARRWLDRFRAVEAVERHERHTPLSSADSIRPSLSLIDVIFDLAGGRVGADARREQEAEAVRAVWARLRKASGFAS